MMPRHLFILGLVTLVAACDKPDRTVRHYQEIRFAKTESPAAQQIAAPASEQPGAMAATPATPSADPRQMGNLPPEALGDKLPLAWTVPEGWEDLGPSGIRLTTLRVQGQECTILSFPGDVGGDEANIRRWFGQINHQPSDEAIQRLLASPKRAVTDAGFDVRLYDFVDILPAGAPLSTLAGMIPVAGQTVFVKLTGTPAVLAAQKVAFEQLCRSIRLRAESAN